MILVDTSVLIDFFKGIKNPAEVRFKSILEQDIPFGITSLIYQGFRSHGRSGAPKIDGIVKSRFNDWIPAFAGMTPVVSI